MEHVVHARWSCRQYDPERPLDMNLLARILDTTTRAPTAYNLQPWHAVVVHEPAQREALAVAALGQRQVVEAPATIVFAGDLQPERNAPATLEMGLDSGAYGPMYGAQFLRNIYYYLHGGPLQSMAATKSFLSAGYSKHAGTPLISVPVSRAGYAWKQTMIPVTVFVHLCTAAGLDSCIIEGIDEDQVRKVVGIPEGFTIPVIVTVGYARETDVPVRTSRFATGHLIRWGKF